MRNVGEETGGEQPLHALVDVCIREIAARLDRHVAANGLIVDSLVSADLDAADHGGLRNGHGCKLNGDGTRYCKTG